MFLFKSRNTLKCVLFLLLKVLRLLEGDMVMNEISGRFSGRLSIEISQRSELKLK